jgi:hypothetical protein
MVVFYQKNGVSIGPLTATEFFDRLKTQELEPATPVRTEDQDAWSDLETFLRAGGAEALEQQQQAVAQRQEAEAAAAEAARDECLLQVAFSDAPLAKLPAKFGSPGLKAVAYADFLQEMFPLDEPPGLCTILLETAADERAIFHWVGNLPNQDPKRKSAVSVLADSLGALALGPWAGLARELLSRGPDPTNKFTFETAHDFSSFAAREQRSRWRWSQVVWGAGAVAAVAAMLAGVYSLVVFFMDADTSYPAFEQAWDQCRLELAALGGLAVVSWALLRQAKALRLPRTLRTLEKRPFRLQRITWVSLH